MKTTAFASPAAVCAGKTENLSRFDLLALALVWLAWAARLYRLDFQSMWGDEAFALRLAREPFNRLLPALAASEPHPPLYYGSLHIWRDLAGESDFALRALSVFFSVIAVAATYGLARRLLGNPGALAATAVTAINAFQVWYAQEARMYAMLVGLTVWSTLLLINFISTGGRWRAVAYVAVTCAALYSHYHALFILLFQGIVAVIWLLRRRPHAVKVLVAQAILVVLFLPWFLYAHAIFRSWSGWMPPLDLWSTASRSFAAHTLGTSFPSDWHSPVAATIGALAAFALLSLAVTLCKRRTDITRAPVLILGGYALIPLVGTFVLSELLGRSLYHERYLIVVSPAFYLLIGQSLGWKGWRAVPSVLATAGVIVASFVALNNHYFDWHYQKDDLKGLARFIDVRGRDGDVVVSSITRQWLYQHYARVALPIYLIPPEANAQQAAAGLGAALQNYRRVWYLPYAHSDVDLAVDNWLAAHAFPAGETWFNSARVALAGYSPPFDLAPRSLTFDRQLKLTGLAVSSQTAQPGDIVDIRTRWLPPGQIDAPIKASIRLLDQKGHVYAQTDPNVSDQLRSQQSGRPVDVNFGLLVPVDTPPGNYRVELRLYETAGRELSWVDADRPTSGTALDVTPVSVTRAARPASPETQSVMHPARIDFGNLFRLRGLDLPGAPWYTGDRITVGHSWLALHPNGTSRRPVLILRDAAGSESDRHELDTSTLPMRDWRDGELIHLIDDWRIPPRLSPGQYQLSVALIDDNGRIETERSLLRVAVARRARAGVGSIVPEHATDFAFGKFARLIGYDLSPDALEPGGPLRLTLHWQASGETDDDYKVFTHLLSPDNRVVAQHDALPCDGQCPTTAWVEGDLFVDQHELQIPADLPSGRYRLEVGLYRPTDNARAPVSATQGEPPDDHVILDTLATP